jgi:uncharacterized phage-associated protein
LIYYPYNEIKATQAAGVLLKKSGGRMDYYLLTKMLYIAERESLKKWIRAMFGGILASMPHGPVHSSILDSARYKDTTTKYWMDNISKPEYNVIHLLITTLDDNELSEREVKLLNKVYEDFKDFDFDDLKKLTHAFPEYENPGKSSLPINIDTILHKFKKTDGEIETIEANASLSRSMVSISC